MYRKLKFRNSFCLNCDSNFVKEVWKFFFFFGIVENVIKYCFLNGIWMLKVNYNVCMFYGIVDENDIEF